MRAAAGLLLALLALSGCLAGNTPTTTTGTPAPPTALDAPRVDVAALLADLKEWSAAHPLRADNHPDHEGARQSLADRFRSFGLDVWRHNFTTGIPQANIVGIKWGALRDQWVVVGGHYDVVPTPGCATPPMGAAPPQCPEAAGPVASHGTYDDGSGTMLAVHLAKAWAQLPTPYTIAFVAFDGEERGLEGSRNLTEALVDGRTPYPGVTVRAMLDLDMFGLNWPSVDSPIYFDDNSPELRQAVKDLVARLHMPEGSILYQGISLGRSDYDSFFRIRVPTGFFISDFEQYQAPANLPATAPKESGQAYPFWHREDTYETMRLMAGSEADLRSSFQTAADLATGLLHRMAVDPTPLTSVPR